MGFTKRYYKKLRKKEVSLSKKITAEKKKLSKLRKARKQAGKYI